MSGRDERMLRAGLALAYAQACLTCGRQPDVTGCFLPYDSRAWGAKPGRQRAIFYALCEACLEATTLEQREAALKRRRRAA